MSDEEIIKQYSTMVYRIAYGYARSRTDTDDIFQNVFLTYFKKKRKFDSEEHRKAWFIRVAINAAKDFINSRKPYVLIYEIPEDSAACYDTFDDGDFKRLISVLDSDSRDIVYLFYSEDMSVKQISEALEINENTVKTRLSRARDKLESHIKEKNLYEL